MKKGWYSEIASFGPSLLLIITFVVVIVARAGSPPTPGGAGAASEVPVVSAGWIVMAAMIPWIVLAFLLVGAGLIIYGMLTLARRIGGPRPIPPGHAQPAPAAADRTVLFLVTGAVIGASMLFFGALASEGWYEYHLATADEDVTRLVNQEGWQVVPGQPDPSFLRRARLFVKPLPPSPAASVASPVASPSASPSASPEASPDTLPAASPGTTP